MQHSYYDLAITIAEDCPGIDLVLVERAYQFAAAAHDGTLRKSGEPYIQHPIATARILAGMQLDTECIAAALLHDVPEDTERTLAEIEREFGATIANLVDGVTKLGQIRWPTPEEQARYQAEAQAENLRKMFLAMIDDMRVVLVKLADRLHNMRTLDALPAHKQQRIARETLEIYAPLANRLGIWQLKSELEDLAFHYLEPERYSQIAGSVAAGGGRTTLINSVTSKLSEALAAQGITAEIAGRPKHIYSIAKKMQRKGASFDDIYDVIGVRIICEEVQDCYAALGVVHTLWHPIPGQFDDYIATPKESSYKSLHTAVLLDTMRPLEIQIRTKEMHYIAEYGIAAHWRYKEGPRSNDGFDKKIQWLRQLLEWRDEVADAQEFVDRMKSDIFQELVYVFTPRGAIIELPAGATPIDFAYRIHTDIGHQCVGAKANGQLVTLDYQLQNGQVVHVLTSKNRSGPSRDWLNPALGYLKTATAREKVRQWFRRQEREANIAEGHIILEKELKRLGIEVSFDEVHKHYPRYAKLDDFFAAIGYGAITTQSIANHLSEAAEQPLLAPLPTTTAGLSREVHGLEVQGVGNLLTNLARCCKPMPGDSIIGYITRGKGITVHRTDCPNIRHEPEKERLIAISWGGQRQELYPVTVRLEAWDRVGLLRDVSAVVADDKVNMTTVLTNTHHDHTVTLLLTVQVTSVSQLSRLLSRLETVRDVYEVRRDAPMPVQTTSSTAP